MSSIRLRYLAFLFMLLACSAARAESITINETDLIRLPTGEQITTNLVLPPENLALTIVGRRAQGEAADRLRALDAAGIASGFAGILYDNRDRGHSSLHSKLFPRLTRVFYGFELMAQNADYGLARAILLPAVVLGNSSTAITGGSAPRSLPRFAMTAPGGAAAQARLYAANHVYVYPEHRDYDEVDRFPANWPYMFISQGSSGSDQPFLEALAMTLAAFPAETMARLRNLGLVAPTLQMILRSSLATVSTPADYLTGTAHPVVFDATQLRPEKMVAMAAAMEPSDIPPMVRIRVVSEEFEPSAGLANLNERLFDTPSAIARIWRSFAWQRRMTISAEATEDPSGRPLQFSWSLLQGSPELVEIKPLDPDGRRAEIIVSWHDAFSVVGPTGTHMTSRVDIGVFASNGRTMSAPAIVSVSFPTHEVRSYGRGPDGSMELTSVDYDAIARGQSYDPLLFWSAPWIDLAIRDAAGGISAWARTFRSGSVARIRHSDTTDTMNYTLDLSDPRRPILAAELRRR